MMNFSSATGALRVPLAALVLTMGLSACGGEGAEADIAETVADRQASSAASEECTPETYMAKVGRYRGMAKEVPEDDPRYPEIFAAAEQVQKDVAAIGDNSDLSEIEALRQVCKTYDEFFALVDG